MIALGKISKTIQKYRMLELGDGVVVGVSGGPDSVMLCHALHRLRDRCALTITVAHLNHGIRGAEAARDARFGERFARGLGLPCVVQEQDVPAYCRERSCSLQEAAREVRYRFLEDVRGKVGAAKIALGHNAGAPGGRLGADPCCRHVSRGPAGLPASPRWTFPPKSNWWPIERPEQ